MRKLLVFLFRKCRTISCSKDNIFGSYLFSSSTLKMEQNPSIEIIETFLMQYPGGEIKLLQKYWDDGIALLCISHVEKKNAISGKMMVDLRNCVLQLEKWKSGKAVILFGEGDNFCSGGDLDFARKSGTPTSGLYMSCYMHDILKRFRKLPLVTVSLVHGPTVGGGAELTLLSDYIIVADNVKLGFVHGTMGIMTAWGGGTRLLQIVDERKALEMLLSSKIYKAQELVDLGYAYKIVEVANRWDDTLNFVKSLTVHDSSIIQSYKRVTNQARDETFEASLDFEKNEFYPKWGSELNKAALDKRMKHVNVRK